MRHEPEAIDSLKERIRDRFQAWKESAASTMIVATAQPEAVRLLAELAFS